VAVWDPPQPLWKRNLAGVLDFLLASVGFGFLLQKLGLGSSPTPPPGMPPYWVGFQLNSWQSLLLLLLVIAYFVVLGRTGGTVFQRLFGMKRAKKAAEIVQQF
jgi:CDP-diglyceride synthetase